MERDGFAAQVSGVAALAEPIRRELYLYVAAQQEPVSRDEASEGVGVPRHTAKFHLDRLVEEGLLETDFKRLSGRRGPGAGRPTKRYRRSGRQVSVALPERRYDLAGQLMARAIDDSVRDGSSVLEALRRAAADLGAALGTTARAAGAEPCPGPGGPAEGGALAATGRALAAHGYEPRIVEDTITLGNCPFHALAREHTELVCGMNLALVGAIADRLGGPTARLDPAAGRCCVVLTADPGPVAESQGHTP